MEGAAKGSFPYHLVELCAPRSLLVLNLTTSCEPAGPQNTRNIQRAPITSLLTSLVPSALLNLSLGHSGPPSFLADEHWGKEAVLVSLSW